MRTKIVSAFPGTGKTFFCEKNPRALDSDSSRFSWHYPDGKDPNYKIRDIHFPKNYIEHIQSQIGKFEYIFVSTHKEVREALHDNCLFFHLVYPSADQKGAYLQRYLDRGSPAEFIKVIHDNWDAWLVDLRSDTHGCSRTVLPPDCFISDLIRSDAC